MHNLISINEIGKLKRYIVDCKFITESKILKCDFAKEIKYFNVVFETSFTNFGTADMHHQNRSQCIYL